MQELKLASKYLIFKCLAGSKAYGTDSIHSDTDIRGIFIAPPEFLGPFKSVEQVEVPGEDTVIHELANLSSCIPLPLLHLHRIANATNADLCHPFV